MRETCLQIIYELAKQDDRILFIGSDLTTGTLEKFKNEMPDRFFMEGVSEANLLGVAAGLALEGKIPYLNTIATFITRRSFEQLVLDLCLHNANVRLIGNGGGLVYAPLGPTHEAIEDIAILRSVPNITILAPADSLEMRKLMPHTVNHQGPIYLRLAKGHDPLVSNESDDYQIGKAIQIRQGADVLLITTGITLGLAKTAADILAKQNIESTILHCHTLKPLDTKNIIDTASTIPIIVTIEEHSVIGGLGSAVAELIAESNFYPSKKFKRIGIPDTFPNQYGSQSDLMKKYSITTEGIVSTVNILIN